MSEKQYCPHCRGLLSGQRVRVIAQYFVDGNDTMTGLPVTYHRIICECPHCSGEINFTRSDMMQPGEERA